MKKNAMPRNAQVNLRHSRRTENQPCTDCQRITKAAAAAGRNIPSSTKVPTTEQFLDQHQITAHLRRTYQSSENKCPIVYDSMRRELLDSTMKKLINPKRHCVQEEEKRQLYADQSREKIL
jgi:hypothetical protein